MRTAAWALVLGAAGCAGGPDVATDSPGAVFAYAERAIAEDRTEDAVEALAALRESGGLPPEALNETDARLSEAVDLHIERSLAGSDAADDLLDLFDLDLPRHLQARAGVAAARAQLVEGDRRGAFGTIRRLDERDPGHVEHLAAGDVVARAGFSLAADPGRYFLGLATYRGYAPTVLEYLVLNYPSQPRAAEAYWTLAQLYEEDGEWDLAIARHEELVLYHRESRYAVESELRIPELRMRRLLRVDYDRGGLVEARAELQTWLARHAGHPLEARARELLTRCLRRLARNDMVVARFYRDVDRPYGAWQHAERALSEAQDAGDEALAAEIRRFLANLPPLDRILTDIGPPEDAFGPEPFEPGEPGEIP